MNNLVLLDGNKISGGINYITPECYSTEERVVGCWVDGKPLYAKTIDFGYCPNNSTKEVAHNISNIDKIVFLNGIGNRVVNYALNSVPIPMAHRSDMGSNIQIWAGYTSVSIATASDASNRYAYVTMYYTKTTDTAGSGTWTPSGIPAVHYSTEEHVIGTWIDGSTLYEKTIDFGQNVIIPNNSWLSLNITLNANKIINANGTADTGSYQGIIIIYNDSGTWKGMGVKSDGAYVRYLTLQYTKASS